MRTRTTLSDLLLDPVQRGVEPRSGQIGYVRLFGEPESKDENARTMRFRCSSSQLDRYSEIVEPAAYKKWLSTFKQNPVFVAGHVYVAPNGEPTTIGRWLELEITDDGLVGLAEFMAEDPLSERYWQRYSRGFQKAVSVGWITHAWEMRQLDVDGGQQRVRVFTEVELVEISAVAIPANRESLVRAASALAPMIDRLTDAGDGTGGGRQLSASEIEAAVKMLRPAFYPLMKEFLNTGPGGHLCAMIQDVVSSTLGQAGFHVADYDDIPDDELEPEPSPASEGETLKHELRQLAAACGGGAQQ